MAPAGAITVEFDGIAASEVSFVSSKRLTGTIPPGIVGLVDVVVTIDGSTYTMPEAYKGL